MTDNTQDQSESRRAIVLGGGLAGIASALRLSQAGWRVTLLEARKNLGGRAGSFVDPKTGAVLDNCQHVLMGCCTNLLDLYKRLGVLGSIEWHKTLYFADSAGNVDRLEADDLPAPLHLAGSMARFGLLSWGEKIAITRGMLAMMRLGAEGRRRWRGKTFADWLAFHRQPEGAVKKFWGAVIVSALNEWPARADAGYAIQVFQEGFLSHENGYRMGVPSVPLGDLYRSAGEAISRAGGEVLLGTRVTGMEISEAGVESVLLQDGQELVADVFVSALPYDRLAHLLPEGVAERDARLSGLSRFEPSPIIGAHLWLAAGSGDRDACLGLMGYPHLALTDSPLQWVFNKGWDSEHRALHVHGVISAAYDLVDVPGEEIAGMAVAELGKALPGARGARLVHARVVKEKRATFSVTPEIDDARPVAAGAIGNLFLAGDWCRTGWPATMEGAVRSGYLAADAAMGGDGEVAVTGLVADLVPGVVYRLFSGDRRAAGLHRDVIHTG